jgi:hypothetical protein
MSIMEMAILLLAIWCIVLGIITGELILALIGAVALIHVGRVQRMGEEE